MSRKNYRLPAALLLLGLSAAPASAAVVLDSFSVVIGGAHTIDTLNWFGQGVGSDLSGQTLSVTYSYNPAQADLHTSFGASETYAYYTDGTVNATLTIGSNTNTITAWAEGGIGSNEVQVIGAGSDTQFFLGANGLYESFGMDIYATGAFVLGSTIDAPFTLDPSSTGVLAISQPDYGTVVTLTFAAAPAGVPEPASMTLLSAGLACVGALRRKRAART